MRIAHISSLQGHLPLVGRAKSASLFRRIDDRTMAMSLLRTPPTLRLVGHHERQKDEHHEVEGRRVELRHEEADHQREAT